jgi:hypothetical protein
MKGVLIGCLVSVLCYLSRRAIYALVRAVFGSRR